ncbi:hypothetical protein E2R55_16340 [Vibrio vulnificus]|nr:hypothetical protein E2R55_16340 [Vibrio vulnificus]
MKYLLYIFTVIITLVVIIIVNDNNSKLISILTGTFVAFLYPIIDFIFDGTRTISDLKLAFKSKILHYNRDIRVSISYLFRIKIDDKYFLVYGNRIDQYQPVGGVYKYYEEAKSNFSKLNIKDDDCIEIDQSSKNDLRIRVPGKNLMKFIKWFRSMECREVSHHREFLEELIEPGVLSSNNFLYLDYSYINSIIDGIKYDDHFKCYQLLIADIYELKLSKKQIEEFKKLIDKESNGYIWVDEDLINSLGVRKKQSHNKPIARTAKWTL